MNGNNFRKYTKWNPNYYNRNYSNNMVSSDDYNKAYVTNEQLLGHIKEIKKMLFDILYDTGNEQTRQHPLARNNKSERPNKVVQVSATDDETKGFREDKIRDKYGLDHLYTEGVGDNKTNI